MTRLIVWRHGRTAWNETRRVQGHTDIDLDEVGAVQAAQSAALLADRRLDLIVSSDLKRAASTAQALSDLTGLPVRLDPRLRERYFGPWQGLTDVEIRERYPEDAGRWLADSIGIPEVETVDDMAKRVSSAFRDVADEVGAGTAVLVTHGGSARVGIGTLLGWPSEVWRTLAALHNCHRSELVYNLARGGWQLEAHNLG